MRDEEIRRALTDANPWWRAAAASSDPTAWTRDHRLLRDRAGHDLGFRSQIQNDVATGPITDQLAVLTGPRRIGKSVALLDAAATLCGRNDVDPRQVVHLPCDGMRDRDLRRSQDYLTCGGFPRAVAESIPALLAELAARATSPLSITSTAADLGYPSRTVFDLRLRRLISTLAALWCGRHEDDRPVPGSQAKLYLTDPVLAWLPSRLRAGLPTPDMTRLTEMTIGVSLARAIDTLEEGRWLSGDTIGYARTRSGNEIDLAPVGLPTGSGVKDSVPLECKWVDQGWRSESKTIDGKYGRGILATKSVLDTSTDVWAVPAPLIALLLLS